jgi:nucleotide-binding universal stress UspA family protein
MGGEPLVVYVDGTPSGRDAVAWAIREASRRGVPVRILSSRASGHPHAAGASMIVVGSASFLAMSDLAQGSVAMDVAVHADVPVVVVRPGLPDAEPGPSAGRIVVGVDGTPLSHAAIDFALAEARACGCGVTAVHAVERADRAGTGRAALDRLAAAHPEVRPVVAVGMASKALIAESAGARLLVVGSRGGAGLRGMLLGSVSQAVVHRARCPVAVVRDGGGRQAA